MPDETEQYKQWLVQGTTNRTVIETITISHPALPSVFRLANWDRDIIATNEGGTARTYKAFRFHLERAETSDSLHQTSALVITSLEGRVYSLLRSIPMYDPDTSDRTTPITIKVRLFFNDDLSAPLITPVPIWYVSNVSANFDMVRFELATKPLRVKKTGVYFTAREFPIIGYL